MKIKEMKEALAESRFRPGGRSEKCRTAEKFLKNRKRDGEEIRDYGSCRLTAGDVIRYLCLAVPMCGVIAWTFYRSRAAFAVLLAADMALYPRILRKKLCEKRRRRLGLGFRDALNILSGFISAGYSVENAFAGTLKELRSMYPQEEPVIREFEAICRGLRVSTPVEKLLADLAERSSLEDIRSFAEVFSIAKRTGGDMRRIIEHTTTVIREKTAVSEEIRTMTAAKQYEQKIMNILPVGIIVYINVSNPGFLDVMYETAAGRIVMTVCLMMLCGAYLLQKKILSISV